MQTVDTRRKNHQSSGSFVALPIKVTRWAYNAVFGGCSTMHGTIPPSGTRHTTLGCRQPFFRSNESRRTLLEEENMHKMRTTISDMLNHVNLPKCNHQLFLHRLYRRIYQLDKVPHRWGLSNHEYCHNDLSCTACIL